LVRVTEIPGGIITVLLPYGTTPSFHVDESVNSPDWTATNWPAVSGSIPRPSGALSSIPSNTNVAIEDVVPDCLFETLSGTLESDFVFEIAEFIRFLVNERQISVEQPIPYLYSHVSRTVVKISRR